MTLRSRLLSALESLAPFLPARLAWTAAVYLGAPTYRPAMMPALDLRYAARQTVGTSAEVQAICHDLPRLIDEMRWHDETADTLPAPDPAAVRGDTTMAIIEAGFRDPEFVAAYERFCAEWRADTLPAPDPGAWICAAGEGPASEPDPADWDLQDTLEWFPGPQAPGGGWRA